MGDDWRIAIRVKSSLMRKFLAGVKNSRRPLIRRFHRFASGTAIHSRTAAIQFLASA